MAEKHGVESVEVSRVLSARAFGASRRVLVADDHPDCAESTALFLSLSGFETRTALDGEAALRITRLWQPHICVLDLDMPKLNGFELVRRLRQNPWAERVIMIAMTGWSTAATQNSARQAGFDCYLRKPVDPERLLQFVQSAVHSVRTDHD